MERDQSGTEGQQHWQPQGQYPDGYAMPGYQQQPEYGTESYQQPDAYSQQGYEHPGYEQQAGYGRPGYEQAHGYQPQSSYPQQPTPSYDPGTGYPQQGYYQDPAYSPDAFPPGEYDAAGYGSGQYAADAYGSGDYTAGQHGAGDYGAAEYSPHQGGTEAFPTEGYPAEESAAGQHDAGQHDVGEYDAAEHGTGAGADAERPEVGVSLPAGSSAVTGGGRAARRRGKGGAPQPGGDQPAAPVPDGPLLPRLIAAATGRAPGTDRRTFLIRAGIGAVALVVVAAAGIAVAGGGGSGSSHSAAAPAEANLSSGHSKSWAAPADAATTGSSDGLVGAWVTAKAVIRGDGTGVTAYDIGTGGKLWTVTPPVAGAVPCAMSPTVNSTGVGAVVFQPKAGANQPCTQLVAVDSGTGTTPWKATIATATTGYGASVMVDDTRVVAVGDSAAVGYDISSGKQSWTYTGPGKYCALSGNGTGSTLLLQTTCADTAPKQQAITLDAGTGKLNWWRGLPQDAASYTVLSATPAVVAVHMADPTKDTIMSFSDKGDTQATISSGQTAGQLDTTHGSFDPMPALFFQNGIMYAALTPPGAAATDAGVLAAFTLADGHEVWQATPQEKGRSELVGLDGTAAVVATEERLGQPARLSHYDLATGKESPGGGFPQGTGSILTSSRVLYQSNFVAALPEFTSTYNTAAAAFTAAK
ncbi:PQQ-binding-like beta-propeller repeat protein [Streptacidiphilus sp. EB129]|uniref:outer membrane protein assembly factor BamB family protein n=1 Tax=Streptacidiphilus sp. EB129 TaxID=3156262 RepID=UPI003513DE08